MSNTGCKFYGRREKTQENFHYQTVKFNKNVFNNNNNPRLLFSRKEWQNNQYLVKGILQTLCTNPLVSLNRFLGLDSVGGGQELLDEAVSGLETKKKASFI